MKTSTWVACALAIARLLLATPAAAQVETPAAGPRLGLGVAISDAGGTFVAAGSGSSQTSGLVSEILVPIRVTPRFRLEPDVGLYRNSSTDTSAAGSSEQTTTSLRVGTGLFGLTSRARFTLSYGARVGYLRYTSTIDNPAQTAKTTIPGFFVAAAVGGEYWLSDHVSLGAEVQVRFSSWKWIDSGSRRSETSTALNGALVVRFYFP